jgi:hypothetical protein
VRCDVSRSGPLVCDDALAAVLEEDAAIPFAARVHVRGCADCRQALARQRTLQADLHRLGRAPVAGERWLAGDALVAQVLAGLDHHDRSSRRVRWISRCAVAGAVAGGVAAGVVAVSRGRRPTSGLLGAALG